MPVEIRELVIKTDIESRPKPSDELTEETILKLKQQLLQECQRLLKAQTDDRRFRR